MARDQTTADLAGIFKANMESLTAIQKELGDTFEEANRHWLERAKSEAESASELVQACPYTVHPRCDGRLSGMDRAPHAAARRRQPEMRSRLSKIGERLDQGRGEQRLEG